MKKFRDIPTVTLKEACSMASECDFMVPVLVSGGAGIEMPDPSTLAGLTNVKTKKILYVCGSDTPKLYDEKNTLAKELGVAMHSVGKKAFPVIIAVEEGSVDFYAEREVNDSVVEACRVLPVKEPSKAALKAIRDAHVTTLASAPDARIFWANTAAVRDLAESAPKMFVVEAGSALRGGDQMAHYLQLGAAYAVSLAVSKRDGKPLLTYENFENYAKPTANKSTHKRGTALSAAPTKSVPPKSSGSVAPGSAKKSAPAKKKTASAAPPAKSAPAKSAPAKKKTSSAAPAKKKTTSAAPSKSAPAKSAPAKSAPSKSAPAKSAPAKSAPSKKTGSAAPAKTAPSKKTGSAAPASFSKSAPSKKTGSAAPASFSKSAAPKKSTM